MKNTTILIDFHGVLTDGKQTISHDGKYMFDHVHVRDIRAIRELVARGFLVIIVTACASPIVASFAERVGAELVVARDKSGIVYSPPVGRRTSDVVAIGDDSWDVAMLETADRAFCPADADPSVKAIQGIEILETEGGRGVIAEVLRKLTHS